MNIIIKNIDQDTADKIENIIAEKNEQKSVMQLYQDFEKKWNKLTEDYQKDIKVLNAKLDKIDRPFDENDCDKMYENEIGK